MSRQFQPSRLIDKEMIRRRGQLCLDRAQQNIKLIAGPDVDEADASVLRRVEIEKLVKSQCSDLARFEENLVCQYVLHGASMPGEADVWLDSLGPITIDSAKVRAPKSSASTSLMLSLFNFLNSILPDPDQSNAFINWSRENRHWYRIAGATAVPIVFGINALAYELLFHQLKPNIVPPLIFIGFGLSILLIARFTLKLQDRTVFGILLKTIVIFSGIGLLLLLLKKLGLNVANIP